MSIIALSSVTVIEAQKNQTHLTLNNGVVIPPFGLIVSNYSGTMQQAVFVMWFFVVTIMLLSGLFTPTHSMPEWAYLTTYVIPMHYFFDAIRTVFIRGGAFREVAHQLLALLGIGIIMAAWAVQSYKKNGVH